jgi:hypothetical protein
MSESDRRRAIGIQGWALNANSQSYLTKGTPAGDPVRGRIYQEKSESGAESAGRSPV